MSANTDVVRRVEEAYNSQKLEALDDLIDANLEAHTPGSDQIPPGLEGIKAAHQMAMGAFPDRKTEIIDAFDEGDLVVSHVRMTGTNTGGLPWFGVPANDKPVDIRWIQISRVDGGKLRQTWAQMDLAMMMQQLGVMPGGEG
jgi:predicted ester cyclase